MNIREQAKQLCARYLSKFKWVKNSLFLLNFIVWSKSKKSRTNFPPCRQSVFTSRNKQLKWLISCEPIVENAFLFKSFYDAFTWWQRVTGLKVTTATRGQTTLPDCWKPSDILVGCSLCCLLIWEFFAYVLWIIVYKKKVKCCQLIFYKVSWILFEWFLSQYDSEDTGRL